MSFLAEVFFGADSATTLSVVFAEAALVALAVTGFAGFADFVELDESLVDARESVL
jgi:hypothetical protein